MPGRFRYFGRNNQFLPYFFKSLPLPFRQFPRLKMYTETENKSCLANININRQNDNDLYGERYEQRNIKTRSDI